MKRNTWVFGILITLIVALFYSLMDTQRLRKKIYELEGEIAHSKSQAKPEPPRPAVRVLESPTSSGGEKPTPAMALALLTKIKGERDEEARKNPDMAFTMGKVKERGIQGRFNYLLSAMKDLDANVAQKLKKLLFTRAEALEDADVVAYKSGIDLNSEEYAQLKASLLKEVDSDIKGLLGESYPTFEKLYAMQDTFVLLNGAVVGNMNYANVPITQDQKMALAEIMKDLRYSQADQLMAPIDPLTGLKPVNSLLLERAASFLSKQQLEVLRGYFDEQAAFQRMAATKAKTQSYGNTSR